jgi:CRISPR-associated protein Cmr6
MTQLIRNAIKSLLEEASFKTVTDTHPGLLLQRGWQVYSKPVNQGEGGKTQHLAEICRVKASKLYAGAYQRWLKVVSDPRFSHCVLAVDNRLLMGLSGGAALETGCTLSHTYGMPYIAGSSIKGVVRAYAEQLVASAPADDTLRELLNELFGTRNATMAGCVDFYDAWWVPDSGTAPLRNQPFVMDVVTTHHPDYYQGTGAEATDLDSPVPNALIAVHGSFLFVYQTDPAYAQLVNTLLQQALAVNGIGAKTAAGYGYCSLDEPRTRNVIKEVVQYRARLLSPADQLRLELKQKSHEGIMLMFSKELTKTKERPDFAELKSLVETEHCDLIDNWGTKLHEKNSKKAYKLFRPSAD